MRICVSFKNTPLFGNFRMRTCMVVKLYEGARPLACLILVLNRVE